MALEKHEEKSNECATGGGALPRIARFSSSGLFPSRPSSGSNQTDVSIRADCFRHVDLRLLISTTEHLPQLAGPWIELGT